jgi:hypothetical protein
MQTYAGADPPPHSITRPQPSPPSLRMEDTDPLANPFAGPSSGASSAVSGLSPVDLQSRGSDNLLHHPPSHRTRSHFGWSQNRDGPRESHRVGHYHVVGNWDIDGTGRQVYRESGKIEEIDEEEDANEQQYPTPGSLDNEHRLAALANASPVEETQPLPPATSPPPRPVQIEQAVLTPGTVFSIPKTAINNSAGLSDIGVGRGLNSQGYGNGAENRRHRVGLGIHADPVNFLNTLPTDGHIFLPPPHTQMPPIPMTTTLPSLSAGKPGDPDLEEDEMVPQMLNWVKVGIQDIQAMRDVSFHVPSPP